MVIAHFTCDELIEYLKSKRCSVVEERLDEKLLIIKNRKGKKSIMQIRKAYFPRYVRLLCDDLDIDVPKFVSKHEKQLKKSLRWHWRMWLQHFRNWLWIFKKAKGNS
jgi:hypothetical protein